MWMQSVCRTGVFIICAQVLVHFRPNKSYEKYLKMLVSTMILMQLLLPVSIFFAGNGEKSLSTRIMWFQAKLQDTMEQAADMYEERERQLEILSQKQEEDMAGRVAEMFRELGKEATEKTEEGREGAGWDVREDGWGSAIATDRIRIPPAGKIKIPSVTPIGKGAAADGTDIDE